MADRDVVMMTIEKVEIDGKHFVVMKCDAAEMGRWGPYADPNDALIWARFVGDSAAKYVNRRHGE